MNKFSVVGNKLLFSGACLLIFSSAARAVVVDGFPEACSEATVRQPLPGHIIQLGTVNATPEGLMFSFPDQNDPDGLQTIGLAENVGLIGQNPGIDLSQMIQNGTPSGSFMVAQVFIGDGQDEQAEPVVTCLSKFIPLSTYVPSYFGPEWSWLDRGIFIERLRFKRYHRWDWRRSHRRDSFDSVRRRFRDSDRRSRWTLRRDSDGDRRLRRDRDGVLDRTKRIDRDRTRIGRDRVIDTTKKIDSGLRDRSRLGRDKILDTTTKRLDRVRGRVTLDLKKPIRALKKDTTSTTKDTSTRSNRRSGRRNLDQDDDKKIITDKVIRN